MREHGVAVRAAVNNGTEVPGVPTCGCARCNAHSFQVRAGKRKLQQLKLARPGIAQKQRREPDWDGESVFADCDAETTWEEEMFDDDGEQIWQIEEIVSRSWWEAGQAMRWEVKFQGAHA